MKQGLVRLLYNCCKMFMGWTLHMIMCVLLCYRVSFHMLLLLLTGRPISSFLLCLLVYMTTWDLEIVIYLFHQCLGLPNLSEVSLSSYKVCVAKLLLNLDKTFKINHF